MNKKKITLIIAFTLCMALGVFFIIKPPYFLLARLKAKKTVAEVVTLYQKSVVKRLEQALSGANLTFENLQIALVAIKKEQILYLYGKNKANQSWKLIKSYPFTAYSGTLGPKLKEGDRQIPEGVYELESLNPNSSYHLSLRVNYPNALDKKIAKQENRSNLGGDIMIHGKDVTIGCVPVGDESIEELFILAQKSFKHGVPILMAPIDFRKTKRDVSLWSGERYDQLEKALLAYP